MTLNLDLTHDIDPGFSRSNFEIATYMYKKKKRGSIDMELKGCELM